MGNIVSDIKDVVSAVTKLGVDLAGVIEGLQNNPPPPSYLTPAQFQFAVKSLGLATSNNDAFVGTGQNNSTRFSKKRRSADSNGFNDQNEFTPSSTAEGLAVIAKALDFALGGYQIGSKRSKSKFAQLGDPNAQVAQIEKILTDDSVTEFKGTFDYKWNAKKTSDGYPVTASKQASFLVIQNDINNPDWDQFTTHLKTTFDSLGAMENTQELSEAIVAQIRNDYSGGDISKPVSGNFEKSSYGVNWAAHYTTGNAADQKKSDAVFVGFSVSQYLSISLPTAPFVDSYSVTNNTNYAVTLRTTHGDYVVQPRHSLDAILEYITDIQYRGNWYSRGSGMWTGGAFSLTYDAAHDQLVAAGGRLLPASENEANVVSIIFNRRR